MSIFSKTKKWKFWRVLPIRSCVLDVYRRPQNAYAAFIKFSKKSGRVSKFLRRDLEIWERVLWNFKLLKLAVLFLRGTLCPPLREGRVTHRNFMETSISWNFEVQKCAETNPSFRRYSVYPYKNVLKIVGINESLHLASEKSPPYGRAQRLTRPKCAILGKITRHIKTFFGRFQREERNEKWTTKRYGERGEKRERFTFTLRHRAHDFPTFSGFNFPSAYFEICTVVRLESVGLVLKNASAPPRRVATTWKVSPPPMHFFHFKISPFC